MATLSSETVQNVLEAISDLRGESTVNTDSSRIRAVSKMERSFAKRMFWRTHLLKDQTQNGDGSTSIFTIGSATFPFRMKGLEEVFVGGTTEDKRHSVVDFNRFKNLYNNDNSAKIVYEYYDSANDLWKMKVNPVPANGDVITYSYFYEPPKRTLTTDIVVCPNMDIIIRGALADIYESEDETQKALLLKQEVEQLIEELMGIENAPAVNQLYSVASSINSIKNHGIGNY